MLNTLAEPIFKKPAPGANTDIFASNLAPKASGYQKLLIVLQLGTTSVVNLMIRKGGVTVTSAINNGNAVPVGKLQAFEVIVHSDHAYNLQVATDGAIDLLYLSTSSN